jgi:hypothetical protein
MVLHNRTALDESATAYPMSASARNWSQTVSEDFLSHGRFWVPIG